MGQRASGKGNFGGVQGARPAGARAVVCGSSVLGWREEGLDLKGIRELKRAAFLTDFMQSSAT